MLSRTSKMPCESISLDARQCKTGSKLAKIPGSVCNGCYALKGFYNMPSVKNKMAERMNFFNSIDFVPRMIEILEQRKNKKLFRWFDSGDVQSELMAQIFWTYARQHRIQCIGSRQKKRDLETS